MQIIYSYMMSKFLPTGKSEWRDPKNFEINMAVIVGKVVL